MNEQTTFVHPANRFRNETRGVEYAGLRVDAAGFESKGGMRPRTAMWSIGASARARDASGTKAP
ncbi:MAG TPA: hypothetical protein DEP35_06745 [Deltaproteobacteria bacterium]|nr:hypothetical protein [Deltaproteobacteria bacterium]